ncbi:pickpocket protein 28-like isoform X1 [Harmonia axyridis]|uniref:pickpocket protein 28-like isoform X1 n=1 Tax=Harmonia axyridis TaxID=115357 RepID=UPI001E2763F7|nr:pickpocket protein 28-like isoform X1 [Harmonia axyridis]
MEKVEKIEIRQDGDEEVTVEETTRCKGVKIYLKEYCQNSSIQGLNYVVADGISIFERLWWILVLASCIGGCIYMISEIYNKWAESPVLVSLATRDTPITEIPFPAITVCPEAKLKGSCFNYTRTLEAVKAGKNISNVEQTQFDYMSLLCKAENHKITPAKPDTFDKKFYEFLYECRSVDLTMSYCKWMNTPIPCTSLFKPLMTDEGICYSFNSFDIKDIHTDRVPRNYFDEDDKIVTWDPDDGYPKGSNTSTKEYPRRALLPGALNSLTAVFFTKADDILYNCRDFVYQGLKVSLHMPSRIPRPSQVYFNVGLDRITSGVVLPTLMSTAKNVESTPPEVRNCYFSKERKLAYYKVYSQNNCNMECSANYTRAVCGCVAYYMPRESNTPICGPKKMKCLERSLSALTKPTTDIEIKAAAEKAKCFCIPICVDLSYNVEISSGPFEKPDQLNTGKTMDQLKGYHASAVSVYFKNPFFLPNQRNELYGPTDFISNFGGILGLFTGFSLFSIAELIYFSSIRLVENRRKYGRWGGPKKD